MRFALHAAASALILTAAPALAQNAPPPPDTAAIAVAANAGGCPTRAELVAALEARLPRATLGEDDVDDRARHLFVDRAGEGGAVQLRLLDAAGAIELERRLELGPTGVTNVRGAGRCAALAEAAAQVVVRYLKEIGYRAPASAAVARPAPPVASVAPQPTVVATPPVVAPAAAGRRWLGLVGLMGGGRRGIGGGSPWSRSEALLGLEVRRRWLTVSLAGGVSSRTDVAIPGPEPGAALLLRAYPVRVALGAALPGPLGGTVLPTVGASLDWLSFQTSGVAGQTSGVAGAASGVADAGRGTRFDPALEAGAGWGRRWGRLALALRVAAGWSLKPRDFEAHRPDPIFRSPGGYLRVALETAFVMGRQP